MDYVFGAKNFCNDPGRVTCDWMWVKRSFCTFWTAPASRTRTSATDMWSKFALYQPMVHVCTVRLSASWCHIQQCPWEIGSAWAERVEQGRWVGAPNGCKQHVCVCAWLWKALGWSWLGHFSSFKHTFVNRLRKQSSHLVSLQFQCSRPICLLEQFSIAKWILANK